MCNTQCLIYEDGLCALCWTPGQAGLETYHCNFDVSFFGTVSLGPLFEVAVPKDVDKWMLPDCIAKNKRQSRWTTQPGAEHMLSVAAFSQQ